MSAARPSPSAGHPPVDVVVPFRGSDQELEELLILVRALDLEPADSLVVVDNGPAGAGRSSRQLDDQRRVLVANDVPSSYFARNRGAEGGSSDWLLFIDADVIPPHDLLSRYFRLPPGDEEGVLSGGVRDEEAPGPGYRHAAARYTHLRASMGQHNTLRGEWGYAQTANCMVRRSAFEQVGGFNERVRSGGDADLCFRLRAAGWSLVPREEAVVLHRGRPTLRAYLRQRARHGAGARWLNRLYPGAFPAMLDLGHVPWTARQGGQALAAVVRRDPDRAVLLGVDVLSRWAFELGRLFPNRVRPR